MISGMIAIIVSKQDIAGLNIYQKLLKEFGFNATSKEFDNEKVFELEHKGNHFELYLIKELQIYCNYVDKINADCFVFASRHSSTAGKPSLTVHPIGNWGKAELGGKDNELVPAQPALMKAYLNELQKQREKRALKEFDVCYEVTHHGPLLSKPAVFIELGSSERQWKHKEAAIAIAETIIEHTEFPKCKTAFGIGGPHYSQQFTKIALKTEYALSHMCPKYALSMLNTEMIEKAVNASPEKAEEILVQSKGLGPEKERIIALLRKRDIPYKVFRHSKELTA